MSVATCGKWSACQPQSFIMPSIYVESFGKLDVVPWKPFYGFPSELHSKVKFVGLAENLEGGGWIDSFRIFTTLFFNSIKMTLFD